MKFLEFLKKFRAAHAKETRLTTIDNVRRPGLASLNFEIRQLDGGAVQKKFTGPLKFIGPAETTRKA
jgi:hypothetical protein